MSILWTRNSSNVSKNVKEMNAWIATQYTKKIFQIALAINIAWVSTIDVKYCRYLKIIFLHVDELWNWNKIKFSGLSVRKFRLQPTGPVSWILSGSLDQSELQILFRTRICHFDYMFKKLRRTRLYTWMYQAIWCCDWELSLRRKMFMWVS